jgi:hypothetical protein
MNVRDAKALQVIPQTKLRSSMPRASDAISCAKSLYDGFWAGCSPKAIVAVPETSFASLAGDELSERSEAGAFELFRDLLTREDHVRAWTSASAPWIFRARSALAL